MALTQPVQRGPTNGDFWHDQNRDLWSLLSWGFCRGEACRAWTPGVEYVLGVRGTGMIDPCACQPGRGCAVQWTPLRPCNGRSDSSQGLLSPMQAKTSDQEDRQTRRAERSSRSSTRTAKGSKRRAAHRVDHSPKLIDILFNSFTCDAVPGLSGISWI